MFTRLKEYLGPPYYIVMLPVMFSGVFGLLFVFSMIIPLPENVLKIFAPAGVFGVIFWAARGLVKSINQPKPLSAYFVSEGFQEKHRFGMENYVRDTTTGVTQVTLRKAPAYTVLEISTRLAFPFQGCMGQPPLVFDGFLQKINTQDYTHPRVASVQFKLDSPKAFEVFKGEQWLPLLTYLEKNKSAVYQQKGHEGFFRDASVNQSEMVVSLYQILNVLEP